MTYYKLIISLFIASFGQGVFPASSPASECIICEGDGRICVLCNQSNSPPAPATTTRGRTKNLPCSNCSFKARDNYGLRRHIRAKHPGTVPAPNSKRKFTAAFATSDPANASKSPHVKAILQYLQRSQSIKKSLNNWLTSPNLSTQLEKALRALENGGSLSEISEEFSIHRKYLEKFFDILTKINAPAPAPAPAPARAPAKRNAGSISKNIV